MDTFTFALNFSKKLQLCRDLYIKKAQDYGSSWRILRLSSLDDQMYIKAVRIKTLRETGVAKVDEPVDDAFIALVNYSLIALIQMRLSEDAPLKLSPQKCVDLVDQSIDEVLDYTMQVILWNLFQNQVQIYIIWQLVAHKHLLHQQQATVEHNLREQTLPL